MLSCSNVIEQQTESRFVFCTADVGQGLSQFGIHDGDAVVWDMGAGNQHDKWQKAYERLKKPSIKRIFISHSDQDHFGGLSKLGSETDWNGLIVVSPFEDTAKIRNGAGEWKDHISFEFCTQNDTLKVLDSVLIVCLWPPEEIEASLPLDGRERNRYSLVFMVEHGADRVLVTSDIDSYAEKVIAQTYTYALDAQVMIAPHHGSAGSVDEVFFGYVFPDLAVFSCGEDNPYGHPSQEMVDQLLSQGSEMFFTYLDGSVLLESNGYYWTIQ
ncbi:MAG: ComEC/Rec2 family competence protein [Chitinispirillaceae bacterium]